MGPKTAAVVATNQLYLIEVLVDKIKFASSSEEVPKKNDITILVSFENVVSMEIEHEGLRIEYVENTDPLNREVVIDAGKSYLFPSKAENLFKTIKQSPLYVSLTKQPDKSLIGKASIPWTAEFVNMVDSSKTRSDNLKPVDVKGGYKILDKDGKDAGEMDVFVRLSCLGQNIQTQFQVVQRKVISGETPPNRYLFKSSTAETTFQAQTYGEEGTSSEMPSKWPTKVSLSPAEMTAAKINEILCKNTGCSGVQKFKEFGQGPAATGKGLGTLHGPADIPISYGLRHTFGCIENYGPYGIYTRPKTLDEPFVPKEPINCCDNISGEVCQCGYDDETSSIHKCQGGTCQCSSSAPNEDNTCCCCQPLRLNGGAPDEDNKIPAPMVMCEDLMQSFDKVLCEYREAVRPGGQVMSPLIYSSSVPPLEPIHWDCPELLPKGPCRSSLCPLKLRYNLIPKGPCGSTECPYATPPNCGDPTCPFGPPRPCPYAKPPSCPPPPCPPLPCDPGCGGPCGTPFCPQTYCPPPSCNTSPCSPPPCGLSSPYCCVCGNPGCPANPPTCGDPFCPLNPPPLPCHGLQPQPCPPPPCRPPPCGGSSCPFSPPTSLCSNPTCPFASPVSTCGDPNCPFATPPSQATSPCGNPSCPYASTPSSPCGDPSCPFVSPPASNTPAKSGSICANPQCPFAKPKPSSDVCGNPQCPFAKPKPSSDVCGNPQCPFAKPKPSTDVCGNPQCPFAKPKPSSDVCGNPQCPFAKPKPASDVCGNPQCPFAKPKPSTDVCGNPQCPFAKPKTLNNICSNPECPYAEKKSSPCYIPPIDSICSNPECPYASSNTVEYGKQNDVLSQEMTEYDGTEYTCGDRDPSADLQPCSPRTCTAGDGNLVCEECKHTESGNYSNPEANDNKSKSKQGSQSASAIEQQSLKGLNRNSASEKALSKTKGKKIEKKPKSKFVYKIGDLYPGTFVGHRECIIPGRNVPAKMGWLWNVHTPCVGLKVSRLTFICNVHTDTKTLAMDQLYLLEVLIDKVKFASSGGEVPQKNDITIFVTFGNMARMEIEPEGIRKKYVENIDPFKPEITIDAGKSYLFPSKAENLLSAMNGSPLDVALTKLVDKSIIGKANIPWIMQFTDMVDKSGSSPDNLQPAEVKDVYKVLDKDDKEIGEIDIFVRLSYLGPNIQTQFQVVQQKGISGEPTAKRFLFKSSKVETTFQAQKFGEGGKSSEMLPISPLYSPSKWLSAVPLSPEEMTEEKINTILCKNRDCPGAQKFKEFGLGPAATGKGLGTLYGPTDIPISYGLSHTYGCMETYGPYGIYTRPNTLEEPFIPKDNFSGEVCQCGNDDGISNTSSQVSTCQCGNPVPNEDNACCCCSPLRLNGGAPGDDDNKVPAPMVMCKDLMQSFDKVLSEYKKALGPCGQVICPFPSKVVAATCKNLCHTERTTGNATETKINGGLVSACGAPGCPFSRNAQSSTDKSFQQKQMKSACGSPMCPYTKSKLGTATDEEIMEVHLMDGPSVSKTCGSPKCPFELNSAPLEPIHWDCPDPLPKGPCRNPQCPLKPPELRYNVTPKGPCGSSQCPYAFPTCGDPNCPFSTPPSCPPPSCPPSPCEPGCGGPCAPSCPPPSCSPPSCPASPCSPPPCGSPSPYCCVCGNPGCPAHPPTCGDPFCPLNPVPLPCPGLFPPPCPPPSCRPPPCSPPPCGAPPSTSPCGNPTCPYASSSSPCGDPNCPFSAPPSQASSPCGNPSCPYASAATSPCGDPSCPFVSPPTSNTPAKSGSICSNPQCPFAKPKPSSDVCGNPQCPFAKPKPSSDVCGNPQCPFAKPKPSSDVCGNPQCPFAKQKPSSSPCSNPECPYAEKKSSPCYISTNSAEQKLSPCYIPPIDSVCSNPDCPYSVSANPCQMEIGGTKVTVEYGTKKNTDDDGLVECELCAENGESGNYPNKTEENNDKGKKTSQSVPAIGQTSSKKLNRNSASEKAISKTKGVEGGKKQKSKFVYKLGDLYPGTHVGHRECIIPGRNVPAKMGWLWNVHTPCVGLKPRLGWRPGAVGRTIAKRIIAHRKAKGLKLREALTPKSSKKKLKSKYSLFESDSDVTVAPKPTLLIKKREGCYYITMNPLKDPKTIEDNENPYMDCTPLQFKICKKQTEKEEEPKTCFCGDEGEEEKSSDSELDIEFTPPAGVIRPERLKKKKNVVHTDTQYNTEDFMPPEPPKPPKKEKGKGKGKGKEKGKGKKGKK